MLKLNLDKIIDEKKEMLKLNLDKIIDEKKEIEEKRIMDQQILKAYIKSIGKEITEIT